MNPRGAILGAYLTIVAILALFGWWVAYLNYQTRQPLALEFEERIISAKTEQLQGTPWGVFDAYEFRHNGRRFLVFTRGQGIAVTPLDDLSQPSETP